MLVFLQELIYLNCLGFGFVCWFFIIILRRSLRKGTSSCLGVKESGGNPFQLKAGVSSQPASEIGHFSLQIKKKKIHLAVFIVEECREKGQGGRDRRSKMFAWFMGILQLPTSPVGWPVVMKWKKKPTNKSGNDSWGLSQHYWAAALHDLEQQWEIPTARAVPSPRECH